MAESDLLELFGPDEYNQGWLFSEPMEVGYFPGVKIGVILEEYEADEKREEFWAALRNFLSLTTADRELASPHVFKNFRDVVEAVGPEDVDVEITHPDDVWEHVTPDKIYISRRHRGDRKVYVLIAAECAWEEEHGLQIVYREGDDLCRVSAQDRALTHADAYGLSEEEDRIS